MAKKYYVLAIALFLLIPVATVLGFAISNSINPEIAAGHPDYARNYHLLAQAKKLAFLATLLTNMGLWFLTCFFLIKSKGQPYWWLVLAVLGPFGLALLTMLSDRAPTPGDFHQRFVRNLNPYVRFGYELCMFLAVWFIAFQIIEWKRDLMIMYEAATTGVSRAQIIDTQNASGGMWAFGEGMEALYLLVLIYLLLPICFNVIGRLVKSPISAKPA
jgi:hypothetical protein